MRIKGLLGLPSTDFTALAALLGFLLIDHLSANAQNTLGNFLMLIAQVLETSSNQQIYLNGINVVGDTTPSNVDNAALNAQLSALQAELASIKAQLGMPL